MGEIVEFPSNGTTGRGYLAKPPQPSPAGSGGHQQSPAGSGGHQQSRAGSGGHQQSPGVVVIQEYWGLVPHIENVCERFAGEGFVALAPDLFHGEKAEEPDEAGKMMMGLNLDRAAKDMSGAVDRVAEESAGAKVGVVGFCMGGGLALLLGVQRPDKVGAVVPFYGVIHPAADEPDWSRLDAAVEGHYAEQDDFAGPPAVAKLRESLTQAGKRFELFLYPGTQHAFFNDDRPEVYAPEAAKMAWERTLNFLRRELA